MTGNHRTTAVRKKLIAKIDRENTTLWLNLLILQPTEQQFGNLPEEYYERMRLRETIQAMSLTKEHAEALLKTENVSHKLYVQHCRYSDRYSAEEIITRYAARRAKRLQKAAAEMATRTEATAKTPTLMTEDQFHDLIRATVMEVLDELGFAKKKPRLKLVA